MTSAVHHFGDGGCQTDGASGQSTSGLSGSACSGPSRAPSMSATMKFSLAPDSRRDAEASQVARHESSHRRTVPEVSGPRSFPPATQCRSRGNAQDPGAFRETERSLRSAMAGHSVGTFRPHRTCGRSQARSSCGEQSPTACAPRQPPEMNRSRPARHATPFAFGMQARPENDGAASAGRPSPIRKPNPTSAPRGSEGVPDGHQGRAPCLRIRMGHAPALFVCLVEQIVDSRIHRHPLRPQMPGAHARIHQDDAVDASGGLRQSYCRSRC